MKKTTTLLAIALLLNIVSGYSQTVRWAKGKDLKFLDGQKTMKVVIIYDSMTFDNGKSEKVYQEEVAKAKEAEEAGAGKAYLERWEKSKGPDGVFIDRWMQDFEGCMKKLGIKASPTAKDYKYVVKVYPLAVTEGAASFPGQRGAPAYADFRVEFVEDANPKNVVGSVFLYQVMGRLIGHDWDFSFIGRFKNCFWFGGMTIGREMIKIKKDK